MTQVHIVCPVKGELIPTGTYAVTIEDLEPSRRVVDPCPACAWAHEWTPDEAILSPH